MTNIVLVLVEKTGAVINELLQESPIYQLTFVTPASQKITEYDIGQLIRTGILLKEIPNEYWYFTDQGYTVEPFSDDKEAFYLELDKYDD